jgi:heme oxygenase (biliverdin-IX-beta and delta-forming)
MTHTVGLHRRLREATQRLHQELERAIDIENQISSHRRYAAYLTRLWLLYSSTEDALRSIDFRPLGFDYRMQRRSQLIENDLSTFGFDSAALRDVPRLHAPVGNAIESALGCVYVLEGSALGARALASRVEARLGLSKSHGASFFCGYGEEGRSIWRPLLASLDAIDPYSPQAEQVIESAKDTFLFFQRWLPECRDETTSAAVA